MADISSEELQELLSSGAEVEMCEMPPQRVIVEGLRDVLDKVAPDNTEVLQAIYSLICKLNLAVTVPVPSVENLNNNYNDNKIVVNTDAIAQVMSRKPPNYRFTVVRDNRGLIQTMDAEIIAEAR